jgi:hypothetical protein
MFERDRHILMHMIENQIWCFYFECLVMGVFCDNLKTIPINFGKGNVWFWG